MMSMTGRQIQSVHAQRKRQAYKKRENRVRQTETSKILSTMQFILSAAQLFDLAKAFSQSPTNLLTNLLIKRMSKLTNINSVSLSGSLLSSLFPFSLSHCLLLCLHSHRR